MAEEETEEDREYQRFLSSLLPQEQVYLSFLDEEDEEYRPDEEEEEEEDDPDAAADAASERVNVKISRKELTELLWDSTQIRVPPPAAGAPYLTIPPAGTTPVGIVPTSSNVVDRAVDAASSAAAATPAIDSATLSLSRPSSRQRKRQSSRSVPTSANLDAVAVSNDLMAFTERREVGETSSQLPPLPSAEPTQPRRRRKKSAALSLKNVHGTVTQEQCVQLASQMHKHMQLLLQNYHALVSKNDSSVRSTLVQCRKMINDLQLRADKAQRYKGSLLSKVNLGGSSEDQVEGDEGQTSDNSTTRRKLQDALALRRVTRSLTAAHAAVNHPSMFELVGSQSIDELSATFRRGCSVDERNAVMKEHMMELDAHLITTRRRNPNRMFSRSEETLLAHGVKRFGAEGDAWERIHQHFLPDKPVDAIRHRYKYLMSSKSKMNAIKTLNDETMMRRKEGWLIEEDLRIARGLTELYDDKKRFYRIAKEYLPHRSRTEIRKRWDRIVGKLRQFVNEVIQPPLDERSLEYVLMVKEYLELKLHEQIKIQEAAASGKAILPSLPFPGLPMFGLPFTRTLGLPNRIPPGAKRNASSGDDSDLQRLHRACRVKNLHPALFFTSWSLISPAALLKSTCEHNWPTFIEDVKPPDATLLPATAVQDDTAESAKQVADTDGSRDRDVGAQQDDGVSSAVDDGGDDQVSPSEAPHASKPTSSALIEPSLDAVAFEPVPDFNLSEDDEDDSDYEHDELLSSENEDSESEFEQLELSDGDDDADFDDDLDEDAEGDDADVRSVDSATDEARSGSKSPDNEGERVVRHPLQLRNLRQPASERTNRALAALERRMVTKAATPRRSSHMTDWLSASARKKRTIVPSVVAAPTSTRASITPFGGASRNEVRLAASDPQPAQTATDEWADGSGDDGFECDELLESSDEAESDDGGVDLASMSMESIDGDGDEEDGGAAFPNKKPRLQRCAACQSDWTDCSCSSSARMRQLLRRMREKRSSEL